MATIDYESLRQYAGLFSDRVNKASSHLNKVFPDQNRYNFQEVPDFNAGFIQMEEGYKKAAVGKYNQYLHPQTWSDKAIKEGIVSREVLALIYDDELENLIDWRDKAELKTLLEEEENRVLFGDCFRSIFRDNDDRVSFQYAQKCIGNKFPILSYLFFIKNPEKYLPVRPDAFSNRFQSIGISGWIRGCSWDNYMDFISTIEDVQLFMMEYFHDESITLIDAHSFVWMAWVIDGPEDKFLRDVEKHFRKVVGDRPETPPTPEELAQTAKQIENGLSHLKGEEKEAVVKQRVNQGVFRNLLLDRYNKCCLCNVRNKGLLSASHIKPWAESTAYEKLDPDNGFLMCPNHDRLFDKGYISFGDGGKIMISDDLSECDRVFTNVNPNMSIELREGNKKYLNYHREYVFRHK